MQATYQQKRGAGLLETHHRASGLVQRDLHRKVLQMNVAFSASKQASLLAVIASSAAIKIAPTPAVSENGFEAFMA